MQKKIIALAIAGLASTAAFAQTNVTVYGVADMYYAYGSASGMKNNSQINTGGLSGSRLGFKGTEALGNGLNAVFALEYGLAMDADAGVGAGGAVGRQQYAGLNGGFGTVVAGRLQTAGYDWACAYNPVAGSALDAQSKLGVATLLSCGNTGRANNAVAYISPNFGGVTLAVNHSRVDETVLADASNLSNSYANLASVSYANGPIAAGLVYSKINMGSTPAADNLTEVGLGGSFDLKVVKLFANYQTAKVENTNRNKKYQVGVAVPVGAGTIALQYAGNNISSTAASDNSKAYTLAYTHGLSKRTTAYAGYTRVTNDAGAARAALIAPTAGGNSSVVAVGLRHTF